jgi:cold shock CspA family protein
MGLFGRVDVWNREKGYGLVEDKGNFFLLFEREDVIGGDNVEEGSTIEYDEDPKNGTRAINVRKRRKINV